MAGIQQEKFIKFGKAYQNSLFVAIFVLIAYELFDMFHFILWAKLSSGSGGHYPIEMEFALYITLLLFVVFRSIWLNSLWEVRKTDPKVSLTVFFIIELIVVIGFGIIGTWGILYTIGEMINKDLLPFFLRTTKEEMVLTSKYVMILLEMIGWLFFKAYYKRMEIAHQIKQSKTVHTGINIYVLSLGIPVVWDLFNAKLSLLQSIIDAFIFSGNLVLGIGISFVVLTGIFAIYMVGVFFQFKIASGIINEFERNR